MSEKFRVKYGLQVGDNTNPDAMTVAGDTGNIATDGDIDVKGGNIQNSTGDLNIDASTGNSVNLNAATVNPIVATRNTTLTNSATRVMTLRADSTGTPAAGFGGVLNFEVETSASNFVQSGYVGTTVTDISAGNEDFKMIFGVTNNGAVTTVAELDNLGNLEIDGDLDVKGANITNSTGALTIATTSNGDLTLDPDGTGKVIIAGDLQVDGTTTTINSTTLDVDDKNITLAKGAANAAAADGGGITLEGPTTPATLLYEDTDDSWNFNKKTAAPELQIDNINVNGNTIISTDTDGDISLTPNGIGRTNITRASTTSPRITTSIDDTNGNELLLLTATASAVNELTLANAATGANPTITASGGDTNVGINITAKGTGDMALTFNDGGNLTNTRNYVFGAIRNTNTDGRGNIWELLATTPPTTPTGQFQGVTIDNSISGKNAGLVLRQYGATTPSRARFIFERSRGTAASPSQVVNGDFLGEIAATGYTGAGWINDNVALTPAFFGFTASETWTGTSNVGTLFALSLQPTATTLATGSQVNTFVSSPERFQLRSDQFCIGRGKTTAWTATGSNITGTTLTIGTLTTGTIAVGQQVTGSTLQAGTYIVANISGSGSGSTWTVSQSQTTGSITMQGVTGYLGTDTTGTTTDVLSDARFLTNTLKASNGNTNITLTSDTLTTFAGDIKLGGNDLQSSDGTTQITTSALGATLALKGDTITLESSSGTDYLVIDTNQALFSKPVRTKITTATVAKGGTYTPAATALNSISLEITAGSGTTTIDVSNLTVAGENGVYDVLVYNNSGGSINSNAFEILNGGNTVLSHGGTIGAGDRVVFEINCVDIYATAVFVTNAV